MTDDRPRRLTGAEKRQQAWDAELEAFRERVRAVMPDPEPEEVNRIVVLLRPAGDAA